GTVIRKILTLEHCVEKELLADYYSLININSENFKRIKSEVLNAIKKCGDDILYKTQVYNQLKDMEQEMFIKVWDNIKLKLASPYRIQDIYDLIIF
ncbi:MAG: hypothetical protein ACRCZ1_01170, partial [Cetobacterium sp.]